MAQPGAVVHVVGVKSGADQLLEEVGLLVGALRGAEPGDRARAVLQVDLAEPARDQVQGLVPGCLTEVRQHLGVVDEAARLAAALAAPALFLRVLRRAGIVKAVLIVLAAARHVAAHVLRQRALGVGLLAADQRHGEPLRRGGVVPAVTALHAQPAVAARLLAALGVGDRAPVAVHVVGQRAAHPAVRADRVDRVELALRPDRYVADRLVGQRAGRAGGDALAAGHAGRAAHRVAQVERDVRAEALAAAPDDIVALDVVAGADAAVAQDAGVVVDRDDRAGQAHAAAGAARQPGFPVRARVARGHAVAVGEFQQLVVGGGDLLGVTLARRLVGQQQPGEHGAAALHLGGVRLDRHAALAGAHTGGGERGRAHVHHAHPAHADRVVPLVVAEHGDVDAGRLGGLPDRRSFRRGDLTAVDRERHGPGGLRGRNRHSRSIRPPRGYANPRSAPVPATGRPSQSRPRSL